MPKKSFGQSPQQDEENRGVYDPDDYDATGNHRGSGADPYEEEDLADQEENPGDYGNDSIGTRGNDEEQRKLAQDKKGKGDDNHMRMYNPNGDRKPGGAAANMAANTAARELGPAGTIAKKAVEMMGRGKKGARGTVTGIVAGLCMIGMFAAVNNYANHFLNHMTEVFDKEVAKVAKHEEQKVARTLMQRMVDRALKRAGASEAEKNKMDEDQKKAKEEGRSVAEATESGMIDKSQTLQQLLKDADLELKFNANGELSGILDKTGADVGEQLAKEAPSTHALIEQEWDVSKLYSQRTNFTFHSGSSFNIFPEDGSQDKNAKKTISQAIENGAAAEAIKMAEAEQEKNVPEDADQQTKDSINATEEKAQLIKEVTDATDKEFKESFDAEAAKEAGVRAGLKSINKIGNSLSLAAIATTGCTVKEAFQVAADQRVPKLVTLLMRNYSTLKSLASELNAGKLTSRTVNQSALLYFGNKGLFPNKDGTPKEASLPVTRSAAWHRASNVTVDSNPKSPYYTPDIKPGVTPTRSGPTKIVDTIQKVFNVSGLELACDALTSKGGLIAQTGLTAVQIVANIGTFGAAQGAILAAGTALTLALEFEILPAIPDLFSNVGTSGTNSAVENGNNDEVGGNLAWKDYGRSVLGAVPVSDKTAKQANDIADADNLREKQSQSLAYRTFAVSNPESLVSRLMMRIPLDTQGSIASMGSYFANFPFTIMHTLATVFAPPALHAAGNACTSDPHCITGYVLTDTVIDRYSKGTGYIDNENFLFGTVSYGGKSVKRIDALGNPNTYSPTPSGDSNNDDLLHCFVNSHEQLAYASDGSNDAARENCGSMGSYDATAQPPQPPNDATVAGIYCKALGTDKYNRSCMDAVINQLSDDFNRYCVYQAFSTVARTYTYASTLTDS